MRASGPPPDCPRASEPPGSAPANETLAEFEKRLMVAGRRGCLAAWRPEAYATCRAVLMTGDSNMRAVVTAVAKALEAAGHKRLFAYPTAAQLELPCNPRAPGYKCDKRWADQTLVYGPAGGGRCTVAILFRFLHTLGELERVVEKPFQTAYCSALVLRPKETPPVPANALYVTEPALPCGDALKIELPAEALALLPQGLALAWHGHGLWGLGGFGPNATLNCTGRFARDELAMQGIRERHGAAVVWQSNFPITGHPVITNHILEKDVGCQRERAAAAGVPMADLPAWGLGTAQNGPAPARWWTSRLGPGAIDWHLTAKGFNIVGTALLEALQRPRGQPWPK